MRSRCGSIIMMLSGMGFWAQAGAGVAAHAATARKRTTAVRSMLASTSGCRIGWPHPSYGRKTSGKEERMGKDRPDHHDAELVLRVYELRREAVMRASRQEVNGTFWPRSYEEVLAVTRPNNP